MSDELIVFFASFLVWLMFAGFVVLWFVDGRIKKEQVVHALLSAFIAFTITEVLKQFFHMPRPFLVDHMPTQVLLLPNDPSFPSSHSAIVFALATTIWLHDKKSLVGVPFKKFGIGYGDIYLILAGLVGTARVFANVHYPIDIFIGAFIGVAVAILIKRLHVSFISSKKG